MKNKSSKKPAPKANKGKPAPLPKGPKSQVASGKKPVPLPKGNPKKRINPLDKAIMEGRKVPIKGRKKLPPDYDIIVPGMGYTKPTKNKPPRRIQGR